MYCHEESRVAYRPLLSAGLLVYTVLVQAHTAARMNILFECEVLRSQVGQTKESILRHLRSRGYIPREADVNEIWFDQSTFLSFERLGGTCEFSKDGKLTHVVLRSSFGSL
jgi:hypothetical protein